MTSTSVARVSAGCLVLVAGLLTMGVVQGQQPAPADDPRSTGRSDVLESKDLGVSRRRFDAGARSAWHSHDNGQLLYVEEGRARTQKRGQPLREMAPGDADYTAPNIIHWHGAVPHTHFIQVAVSFGGETKWMEKVTDAQYAGKP